MRNNLFFKILLTVYLSITCLVLTPTVYAQKEQVTNNIVNEPKANSQTLSEVAPQSSDANTANLKTLNEAGVTDNNQQDKANGTAIITSTPEQESILTENLSVWGMFLGAGLIVKAVMIILALLSVLTWAIAIAKFLQISKARKLVLKEIKIVNQKNSFTETSQVAKDLEYAQLLIKSVQKEISLSVKGCSVNSIKERLGCGMKDIIAWHSRQLSKGISPLASVGSVSPFIGLFGTVWGIMNSFIGIAKTQTTNLSVVAPGIAEALLATALGLVAAIPAVILYNYFSKSIAAYRAELTDLASMLQIQASRMLDNAAVTDLNK